MASGTCPLEGASASGTVPPADRGGGDRTRSERKRRELAANVLEAAHERRILFDYDEDDCVAIHWKHPITGCKLEANFKRTNQPRSVVATVLFISGLAAVDFRVLVNGHEITWWDLQRRDLEARLEPSASGTFPLGGASASGTSPLGGASASGTFSPAEVEEMGGASTSGAFPPADSRRTYLI